MVLRYVLMPPLNSPCAALVGLLHPGHQRWFKAQISRFSLAPAQRTRVVERADLQRFFALLAAAFAPKAKTRQVSLA